MLDTFVKSYTSPARQLSAVNRSRFVHSTSVRHKGKVIAFAQNSERRIFYAVLELDDPSVASSLDHDHWPDNPSELRFPPEISEVGVGVVDQFVLPSVAKNGSVAGPAVRLLDSEKDLFLSTTARLSALAPFQALTDGRFIHVFRQAIDATHTDQIRDVNGNAIVDGTLLVDRFVLSGKELKIKLDVRFQRSRSKTRPQNRKDSLGARDMDEIPFHEPTQELRFVGALQQGRFHVLLLPTQVPELQRWQIFAHNRYTGAIDSINVERAADGLFNTQGTQPSSRDGHAESALMFDSSNVNVRLSKGVTLGQAFTQEFWIRPAAAQAPAGNSPGGALFSGDSPRANDGAPSIWVVHGQSLRCGFGDGSGWYEVVTRKILQVDTWNHVAVGFNGKYYCIHVDGEERFRSLVARKFVDGLVTDSTEEPLAGVTPAATPVQTIGDTSESFRGTVDEVRLWHRERSRDELRADKNLRLSGLEPGLAAYWRFDEAFGDRVHDQTNNAAHGVRDGGRWVTSDAPVGVGSGLRRSSFHIAGRDINSGLSALLYFVQEDPKGSYAADAQPIKSSARVMLAMATVVNSGNTDASPASTRSLIMALDFGVSGDGRLAQIPDTVAPQLIDPISADGETLDEKIARVSALGQAVITTETRIVNLREEIAQFNVANSIVRSAISYHRYRTDVLTGNLATLNIAMEELRVARNVLYNKTAEQQLLRRRLSTSRVRVFEHSGFRGRSLQYALGAISYTQLKSLGFNDLISSIIVPVPLMITVYEHARFTGKSARHTSSTHNVGRDWNDLISSFIISENPQFTRRMTAVANAIQAARVQVMNLMRSLNAEIQKFSTSVLALTSELQVAETELTNQRTQLESVRGYLKEGMAIAMPLLHIDPFGLSTSGGLLAFAWTSDSPFLFDSATGKLAMYFRGSDDQFFVAYYKTLTQRARYTLLNTEGQPAVICSARSTAKEMDALTVTVTADEDSSTCTVTLNGADIEEVWRRVPRAPMQFAKVLNGNAGERQFIGVAIVAPQSQGAARLQFDDGTKRSLNAGATILVNGLRLTTSEAVKRGDTEIAVHAIPLGMSSGAQAVFFIDYDHELNAATNRVPSKPGLGGQGSLLVHCATQDTSQPLMHEQTLDSGSTVNSQWVAATPGYTLAFDGNVSHAASQNTSTPLFETFAAPSDLSLEAWVRPREVTDDSKFAIVIQQKSDDSRYALGLHRQDNLSALAFDGIDDRVLVAGSEPLNFTGNITLEAWIRPTKTDGLHNIMAHGSTQSPDAEVYLRINDGKYEVGSWDGDAHDVSANMPDEDKQGLVWVHIAGVFNGSEWQLFRNGVLLASRASTIGALPMDASWGIGASGQATANRLFEGAIDDVRIWRRARDESGIRTDMRRRLSGTETDLAGYWRFDSERSRDHSRHGGAQESGSGAVAANGSALNSHGVVSGNPVSTLSPIPAYAVYLNAGDKHALSRSSFQGGSWVHLAAVYNQSYGLEFNGSNTWLDAGNDITVDINRDLTIEVFLRVDDLSTSRGLLSRGKISDGTDQDVPYSLHVTTQGALVFAFEDSDHNYHSMSSSAGVIRIGAFTRVAVTRKHQSTVHQVRDAVGNMTGSTVEQWVDIDFFSGNRAVGSHKYTGKEAGSSDQALEIGRASLQDASLTYLSGIISDVRIWNTARESANLGVDIKGAEAGLVSWWRLDENEGHVAFDAKSSSHAKLKNNVRWVKNPDAAASQLTLYRNGLIQQMQVLTATVQPTPDSQFALGTSLRDAVAHDHYQGEMEEVRVWRTARTKEQIHDNLFRRVLGEKEALIAYYPFDDESTSRLSDHSLRSNDLHVNSATHVLSTAPIGEDTPQVRSALAGIRTPFSGLIYSRPGVSEYGDMQYDVDNNLIGVLKRSYTFISDDNWQLATGFKVGNLVTEWLGQVQFAPQLIGYIEGAPPVPSENLTGTGTVLGEFSDYNSASSIELAEAETTTYTYATSKDKGFDSFLETKVGGVIGARAEGGFGLVVETVKVENVIGFHGQFENSLGWLEDASSGSGVSKAKLSRMALRGGVEPPDSIAFPETGRRFVPENVGFALVQSDTADVFALRLQHNNALVSFQMRPNPDIPKDWNIITFPINPRYSKQGSLDGKVGFKPESNYPNALTYSSDSSYFKPIEAYAMKNRIQREEERLKTYFDQYEAGDKGRRQADVHFSEGDLAAGGALDKLPKIEKRNLVNTYVWTADGGLFTETEETLDQQEETTGGSYSFKGLAGAYTDLTVAFFSAGIKFELDALFGGHLNLTVTKSIESERSFTMKVDLSGVEGDIYLRDTAGNILIDPSDTRNPKQIKAPGKVDAYRFMTFYLEPDTNHFDHFFSKVVDPIWLEQSDEPNAVALREARQVTTKPPCWRIMHRVTYVSRILPALSDTAAPPLEKTLKELAIDSNFELIKLLDPFVANETGNFGRFSRAIRNTLKLYHPELLAHARTITQYMSLYYGISESDADASLPGATQSLDSGAPRDPVVDAGLAEQRLGVNELLELRGNVDAGEQDISNLYITWRGTTLSGTGEARIADPDSLVTSVAFSTRGRYRLSLIVSDGLAEISDDMLVTVNAMPVVSAGADIELLPDDSARLTGIIADDGLGDAADRSSLRSSWERVSGPGTVVFGDDNALSTTVTFSRSGHYRLRFALYNGSYEASNEMVVAVAARVARGLELLYVFEEGSGDAVRDVSASGGSLPLGFSDATLATWQAGNLAIQKPGRLQSTEAITRVIDAIRESNELTIEAWINCADAQSPGLARILSCSLNPGFRNFVLAQRGNQLYVALRTTETLPSANDKALAAGELSSGKLTHVCCTRASDGITRFYIDGVDVGQRLIGGEFSNWDNGMPLALGNDSTSGNNGTNAIDRASHQAWAGEFHLVAIYSRALNASEVRQNLDFGANTNLSPSVKAGTAQVINLPEHAEIEGTLVDDRLQADEVTVQWSRTSGPSSVEFSDVNALRTQARFTENGRYVLRLSATEGAIGSVTDSDADTLSASDELVVTVNQRPTINAGIAQRLTFTTSAVATFTLHGDIIDTGLGNPSSDQPVTSEWEQTGGPAPAVILAPDTLDSAVRVTTPGVYTFQLTAENGVLPAVSAETTVYMNTEPVVQVVAEPVVTLPATLSLVARIVTLGLFDPEGEESGQWSMLSGDGDVVFDTPNAATTDASFSRSGVYELQFTQTTRGADYQLQGRASVSVIANQAPVVDAGPNLTVRLPAQVVLEASVSDDGLPNPPGAVSVEWSKLRGAGEVAFRNPKSVFTTAEFSSKGTYVLQISAMDYPNAVPVNSKVTIDVVAPPRITSELQALYRFAESAGTTVADVSGVGEAVNLELDSSVPADDTGTGADRDGVMRWLDGGLAIEQPVLIKAAGASLMLRDALQSSNALSVEAWIKADGTIRSNASPGRIVTFSANPQERYFTLGESSEGRYVFRLRTSTTDANGTTVVPSVDAPIGIGHIVFTRDTNGRTGFYVNGVEVDLGNPLVDGTFDQWDTIEGAANYQFAIANELTGDRAWLGEYYLIAVYSRALLGHEVLQNYHAGYD